MTAATLNRRDKRRLARWIAETGARFDVATAEEYRAVAIAFPPDKRKDAPWECHQLLKDHPHLVRDGMTIAEARALAQEAA
jgi:hypothetical protein